MKPLEACAETGAMVNPAEERAELMLTLPDEAATLDLGRLLGEALAAGDVVLLTGELGAGKTVLARGMARGLGVGAEYAISSPSFTLLNVYPGRVRFYHADLYRLDESEALDLELLEEAAGGVLAVEWAERLAGAWPAESILVELALAEGDARRARLTGPADLLERIKRKLAEAE
jgi:tRNA threonylcarbamoyl adenosine modification protein YjeE